MSEIVYPIHVYKTLNRPRYANSRKEFEALQLDGWTDVRANIGYQEFPKTLYSETGETVLVGDYDRDGVVNLDSARVEERKRNKAGYSDKAAARTGSETVPAGPSPLFASSGRIDQLEADMAQIKSALSEILDLGHALKKPKDTKEPQI